MTTPEFLDSIDSQLAWQRDLYRHFHQHPELSLEEHQTAERIESELTDLGLEVKRIGDTGLDYASTVEGVMHACGHDMHATALLGAVRLLNENRNAWSGTYIALFQPAEENAAGAKAMIDDGLTTAVPKPDVALAQHVMPMPAGRIFTASGPVMSAGDSVKITVFGRGAHGSMPHLSVDPVVLAASIVLRLQTIVSRETEPGEFAVVTVGASNAGSKSNIIPDRAELLLNVRTYDTAVRQRVIDSIERIVRGECEAAGSPKEPTFEYFDQFPLTDNSEAVNDTVTEALTGYFGDEVVQPATPATASEDFSELPTAFGIPYAYWFVGSFDAEKYKDAEEAGTVLTDVPANHSPFFAPEIDPTLEIATKAQAIGALAYLGG
ncbi:amidohydrolase [Brevibacterium atlanticum]|uniref:amidohydrolase n=1 Tax=Brevibacterium atlanticum TaxID=2697563 RepID=UPI0014211D33|nr:amidohydrolase [Brevibacterium atlanticum]